MSFDDSITGDTHLDIMFALRDASARAAAEGSEKLALQHDVASRAMSLMAKYDSPDQPYVPMVVTTVGNSGSLADFSAEDVGILEDVLEATLNDVIRGRVADVLFLIGPKGRRAEFGKAAIEAYERHSIDGDAWWDEGDESFTRAFQLAGRLGKAFTETRERLAAALQERILDATSDTRATSLSMADLLWREARGLVSAVDIASALSQLSREAETNRDIGVARNLAEASGRWHAAAGDAEAQVDAIMRVASLWIAEAGTRSGMVAAVFYQDALQTLRQIPRSSRPARNVDAKIAEVIRLMQEANQDALDEMHVIESEPFDGSGGARAAEALVRGKTEHEALRDLALRFPTSSVADSRARAVESLQEHPFRSLFQTTHVARDGRVVHKTPGATVDDQEAAVHRLMLEEHSYRMALVTQSLIVPALLQIRSEHDPTISDFGVYCRESGFVPPDRVQLFAKGLYFGFELDMEVAIHLLAPQLENAVRQHLKSAGVNTTFVDGQGIEMEIGLTSLMDKPEAEELFGPDLSFEIKATFTDQLGSNFRNDVAHGLIGDNIAGSGSALYAWWICLRIVMVGFWNRVLGSQGDSARDDSTSGDSSDE